MGAWKQFLASDIIVNPFTVNKSFILPYSQFITGSDGQLTGIDRFLGVSGSFLTNTGSSGTLNTQYNVLTYNSIKELYYSNFLSSSYGDEVSTGSIVPGENPQGDVLVGSTNSTGRYFNYLQSTLTSSRFWPTGSGAQIGVISVPSKLFGLYIQPNSFIYTFVSESITHNLTDDGEGNLLSGSDFFGNVIYTHGIITLTGNKELFDSMSAATISPTTVFGAIYGTAIYGSNYVYGTYTPPLNLNTLFNDFATTNNFTCSFSSSYTIFEKQYKCTIRENEYNFTLNPSTIRNDSTGSVYGFVTGSEFSPYITTVGLYDEYQNLLAVGKLAQPLQTSNTTDTTILINIDR